MKTSQTQRRKGFTLAEMMVVIVIIGILATIVVPNVWQKFFQGQKAKVKADITVIKDALDQFAMSNNGQYPDSLERLVQPDLNGHRYLNQSKVPKDPWNEEYQYEPPSPGQPQPRIFTMGRDKSLGGEGEDADIDYQSIVDGG
ncbi:MAG: type II secretion system major pseudopilin GspG [Planctomycetes bacterium]|nr:type II secretion system major pseudopilin GspG [Planctomycetota bacterium]